MTLPDWNVEDYIVDFPDIETPPGTDRVDFHIIRKIGDLVKYILGDIIPEARKATQSGCELAGLLLTLAAIDCLASYYMGKETTRKDYKAFMKRYFPEKYYPYFNAIYSQLRCGLMHNLVAMDAWWGKNKYNFVIQGKSLLHLEKTDDDKLSFSVPIFIEDTRRAFVVYQHELVMHPDENADLLCNFETRFNKQEGKASVIPK